MAKGNTSTKPKKTKEEIYTEKCLEAQSTWSENNFNIKSRTEDKIIYIRKRTMIGTLKQQWYIWIPFLLILITDKVMLLMFGSLSPYERGYTSGSLISTGLLPFLFGLWVYTKIDSQKILLEADPDAKCPKEYHLTK